MIYLYDGTFEGFLSCVSAHYYAASPRERAEEIWSAAAFPGSLHLSARTVPTDETCADKVCRAVREKLGSRCLRRVYRVFRSSVPDKDTLLLRFLILLFRTGGAAAGLHSHPDIKPVENADHKVTREIDRLLGLARFSRLKGGILYGPVRPDHDILEFLAPHFANRLKKEAFLLHDTGRNKAVVSAGGQWYMSVFTEDEKKAAACAGTDADEAAFRRLWKTYFDAIAIRERRNPRCQKAFMPVRYWKYLTEMQDAFPWHLPG